MTVALNPTPADLANWHAPWAMPPKGHAAMAATYTDDQSARDVQQMLKLRWGLPATLLSADIGAREPKPFAWRSGLVLTFGISVLLVLLAGVLGALLLAAAVLVLATTGLWKHSRIAFDAMVAHARRKGHAVLVLPEVPQAIHEDVSALLFNTGLSWWHADRS